MHICLIGAGIVGLAAAYTLHQRGVRVTVIDQARAVGSGASGGNGAQLSYAYVQPLADPAIWRQLPKLFLQPDSPLKFRLQADPHQWFWGARFLAACRGARSRSTTATLLALAAQSRSAFDAMRATTDIDCDYAQPGKLVLLPSTETFAAAQRQMQVQAELGGATQHALGSDAVVQLEPSLASYAPQFVGAIHTPSEAVADTLKVCEQLAAWLTARGVDIQLNTPALSFVSSAGTTRAIRTPNGEIEADQFIVCAGWESQPLLRSVGEALPVYPLKGYSITLDLAAAGAADVPTPPAQTLSVTDTSRKVVFARIGQRLRVAGMVELVGQDQRLDATRIDSLKQSTAAVFPGLAAALQRDCAAWTGMRPATPTGVPILRPARAQRNLWLNTGHGALGLTLAFGSAERLAQALHLDAPSATP